MSKFEVAWSQKYRPTTVEDTILPDKIKSIFQKYVDQNEIPQNLLLSGGPGVGKTTVAKAVLEEIGCDYIVINGSLHGNIDTLRHDISNFASTTSFVGGRKYVILDEADHLNCLDEDETVQLSDGSVLRLGDMEDDKEYAVLSVNTDTGLVEEDEGTVIKRKDQQVFELELYDGSKIRLTDDHPIMCLDSDGNIVERTIIEGFDGVEVLMKK